MSEIQVPSNIGWSGLVLISLPCLVKETKTLLSFCWRQKRTWGHDTPSQQWATRRHWAITEHLFPLASFQHAKRPPVDNASAKQSNKVNIVLFIQIYHDMKIVA